MFPHSQRSRDQQPPGRERFAALGVGACGSILEPRPDVDCVYSDAKQVGGNEAKLRSVESNCTNNEAIDDRENKAEPELSSHQHGGKDGE